MSRPADEDDEEEAVEDGALCWDEETLVLMETLVELAEVEV